MPGADAKGPRQTFRIRNDLREIPRLAEQIEAFCAKAGVSMASVYPVNLVLDEWLTNLVSYAFEPHSEHEIQVDVASDDDGLTIAVTDDGRAFNPLEDAPPARLEGDLEERKVGGLGIHFMKTLMDEIDYQSMDGRNRLTLRKVPAADD